MILNEIFAPVATSGAVAVMRPTDGEILERDLHDPTSGWLINGCPYNPNR